MESLSHFSALPWLYIGDFNEISSAIEKEGGNIRLARQMTWFCDVIHYYGFHDLGFHGVPYNWFKNQPSLQIRLDIALVNHAWKSKFIGVEVHHVNMSTSDHYCWHLGYLKKRRSEIVEGRSCLDLRLCGCVIHSVTR